VRVLVLGCKGLVGSSLFGPLVAKGAFVAGLDLHDGGDVRNLDRLRGTVLALPDPRSFDWVVNLAAMTAVDACESDPAAADAANAEGARNAALVAGEIGARLLLVSTDYVFDGARSEPYAETDAPNPLSVYGRSKLRGEERAREVLDPRRLLVVRGQSLYGEAIKSFPDAIARAARDGKPVRVVTDQVVSPTWAADFAAGLVDLMVGGADGLFHLSASGHCTWFEFAEFVFREWRIDRARLEPTTVESLGRPAPRPAWSVFDLRKFETAAGRTPRRWEDQFLDYSRSKGRAA